MDAKCQQWRATALAGNDLDMRIKLIEIRRANNITQEDVAKALGISQQAVSAFERLESDPRLSTIRQYANAIGAMVRHDVRADGDRDDDLEWFDFNHDIDVSVTLPATGQSVISREAVTGAKNDFALTS
ncbi:MAG: helix-turn-helix transcriptional regulator [Demequinaceae bacterium]|nr:helix-turn-helix transcriptional regulator [Demequinaceae bacterium]